MPASTALTGKAIVLVVEDEPILRMAAVDIVEDAGFDALEAADADEAIRLLETNADIRLIFTDIEMPKGSMNGLKLAAAVRKRWPPVQIIIVSGRYKVKSEELPDGALFFTKPYQRDDIISAIQKMAA